MHTSSSLAVLAATFSSASAAFQGFNYGSTFTSGAAKAQSDFEAEFKTAKGLAGTNGAFSSARLYTTIQAGTANTPISAIAAAVNTKTSLLLGMWASAGPDAFGNELQALKSAISTYGSSLGPLVAGISVGSEDLYRISPIGIINKENPGAGPDVLTGYIKQVRDAIAGTPLSGAPIGHVDTWTAWVNSSNKAVADASDWIGVDAYPYFQNTMDNGIENGKSLFDSAIGQTQGAVGGKPVWITETGFPVSGKTSNKAIPSVDNAKTYWDQVGCPLFGKTNVWWYTLEDAAPDTPNPSFGIVGSTLSTTPLYDLSCKDIDNGSSSSPKSPASPSSSGNAGPTMGGGSPGAGQAAPSSQISIETASASGGASSPKQTGSGAGGTSTGSGSSSPNPTTVKPNAAGHVRSGSFGAAFGAIMAAMLAL